MQINKQKNFNVIISWHSLCTGCHEIKHLWSSMNLKMLWNISICLCQAEGLNKSKVIITNIELIYHVLKSLQNKKVRVILAKYTFFKHPCARRHESWRHRYERYFLLLSQILCDENGWKRQKESLNMFGKIV